MKMQKKRKQNVHSLKEKQFSSFLISFLIPSLALIVLLFSFFIHQACHFHSKEQENTLEVLSSHLTAAINSDLQMSLTYIYSNDIAYFYNFLCRTDMEEDLVTYHQLLAAYTKAVSSNVTLLNENIMGLGFFPCEHNEGLYFYIPRYKDMSVTEVPDYEDHDWYSILQEKNTNVVFTSDRENQPENSISIIRAAKNVDKKLTIGYVVVDVSMDFLYNLLDRLSIDEHSGILLFSPQGELLFSTNESLAEAAPLLTLENKRITYNGEIFDVKNMCDENYGFTFYYLSSVKDLYAGYFGALWIILLFCVIMVIAALVMFRYNAAQISASIAPILQTMAKYHGGETKIQCKMEQSSITEFRLIAENLNEMIQKVNLHIEKEYKLEIAQKAAEFQALQAEVDPHFLYNTLNLLISLNRIGAKTELEKAIISLSHLFRYTCEHTSYSTVEKEFAFITDYLYLQQIRFEDRLSFQLYIEPGLENFRIPKLLIQPLVENAIVHSLEPSGEAVNIQLTAATVQSKNDFTFMILSVVNTGLPFLVENVSSKRVGLKNIEERLTIFNPNSFFVIGGGIDKPTKCYIMIPIEKTEET